MCPLLLFSKLLNGEEGNGRYKNSFFVHFQASTDGNLETGDWLIANRSDCSRSSFASLSNNLLRLENPRGKSWFQTCICWGSSGIFMYPCYCYLCTLCMKFSECILAECFILHPRGRYDYFLLLLGKSSIWFTKKHFFRIIISHLINIWQVSWQTHSAIHGQIIHPMEKFFTLNLFKIL